jgi:hypothetical protein
MGVEDIRRFKQLMNEGASFATWREPVAERLFSNVATNLLHGVSMQQLGDLHFDHHGGQVQPHASAEWSDVVVLYLGDEAVNILAKVDGREFSLRAEPGTILLGPENAHLLHSAAVPVAWLRVRRSPRPFFDYNCATWIRHHFVAQHGSETERKFLRANTRHPALWHTFIWSFLGVLWSALAMMPLAWRALVYIEGRFNAGAPITAGTSVSSDLASSLTANDDETKVLWSGAVAQTQSSSAMTATTLPTLLVAGSRRALRKQQLPTIREENCGVGSIHGVHEQVTTGSKYDSFSEP